MLHSIWWSILSNAFSKSINVRYSDDCHSMVCSIMMRRVAIWSLRKIFPVWTQPACSSLSTLPTYFFIICKTIWDSALLRTESNMMPLQFPQIGLSPILGSFTHLVQSCVCSFSHILFKIWWNLSMEMLFSAFIASGGMLSTPPALLLYRCLTAVHGYLCSD